jgi:hypothetical protein
MKKSKMAIAQGLMPSTSPVNRTAGSSLLLAPTMLALSKDAWFASNQVK